MVDGNPPQSCGVERSCRGNDVRVLMGEEAFDLKAVRKRHIDRNPARRRTIEIDRLLGHDLEEVSAETISRERCDFDRLRGKRRRLAKTGHGCHRTHKRGSSRDHVSAGQGHTLGAGTVLQTWIRQEACYDAVWSAFLGWARRGSVEEVENDATLSCSEVP